MKREIAAVDAEEAVAETDARVAVIEEIN